MDEVFGLKFFEADEKEDVPKDIQSIAKERQTARENKDWTKSDELRDSLKEKGWNIKDTKESFELEKLD